MIQRTIVPLCLMLVSMGLASGQDAKSTQARDGLAVTRHTLTVGDRQMAYTATAGTITLKEEDGKALANIFFVAYTKNGVDDPGKRPITFTFNGGPGSSSVWLHMGAFGPRKVAMDDDGNAPPPPYKLNDNKLSLLEATDLVFIDPVTTGFSRPAPGVPNSKFHGVDQDIDTVGEFIRLYTARFQRWPSPKFLAGESYGGTRACALVAHLQDRHNMNFNGVILISPAINFETLRFDEGNDLPYICFLPTYAATAWYHKRLGKEWQDDLPKTIDAAKKFAYGEYAHALLLGDRLAAPNRVKIAARLGQLTGLSEKYVLQSNLRVQIQRFCRELLREQRKTVGRYDSRFTGQDKDAAGERAEFDPSGVAHDGPFTATVNHYLRNDLKYESDLTYEILTGRVQPWDYGTYKNRYLNVAPALRQAMTKNRDLKVFVADGYYDLATPFVATDYSIEHLGLEPELLGNLTTRYYEAGHMMYVHRLSHEKLHGDLTTFYKSATHGH